MKMFSECSGGCCVCACSGFCLAGHGDDCFSLVSKERIIKNLDEEKYPSYTQQMIDTLKNVYGYEYYEEKVKVCTIKENDQVAKLQALTPEEKGFIH